MKDKLYKITCKAKFNNTKFNNRLSELYNRLKKEVSDDVIYSHTFWMENDNLTQNISIVKDSIINSIIKNKYTKVYKI